MNKKRFSYVILTVTICFLAFSVYYMTDYITNMMGNKWVLEEIAQTTMGDSMKDGVVDQMIQKVASDPSIVTMIEKPNASADDYVQLAKKLGVENVSSNRGVIGTGGGCSIFTLDEDQTIRYQWTNQIKSGSIEVIIKDINGNIVLKNDNENTSVQDEISLLAGNYFAYVNWNVKQDMSYNLYITMK